MNSCSSASSRQQEARSERLPVELDDLIFALQRSGGASVYWREVTTRLQLDPTLSVSRVGSAGNRRGVPVLSRAKVFHSSHFRVSVGRARNVSTVHDLHYELGLMPRGIGSLVNRWERRLSYFTADALICISENTRNDLLEIYPALRRRCPIVVIHHGVSVPQPPGRRDAGDGLPDAPFILYVGGRKGYKNFATALDGYVASGVWRDGVRLVCTGSSFDEDEKLLLARAGVSGLVSVYEHCPEHVVHALYRAAHCLLYTSQYEGFGLPPLEAMANRCPVIAANASSLPEVCGGAALLVSPNSPEEVACRINELQDETLRRQIVQAGTERVRLMTWERSAQMHSQVYHSVVS